MRRLTGFDAQFVYDDGPAEPQSTLKLAFLGPAASARCTGEALRRELAARLPALPPLRWRTLRVPADLHHPVWVDDPELELDAHVRRVGVPAPGGRRELCALVSEIASHPLDPTRPLWELWLLEGYLGDRVVAVLKLSHALADGAASRLLVERLWSDAPPEAAATPAARLPSRAALLAGAARDLLRGICLELPRLARAAVAARRRIRAAGGSRSGPRPSPFTTPRTPFAGPLSRRRGFAFTTVSLDVAREIRSALGCKLNDVVVATVAGGVRRYLLERGELPGLATLGAMPVSIRRPEEAETFGNRVTTRFFELPTQLADPLARLRAAAAAGAEVKREAALREGAHLEEWLSQAPPIALELASRLMRTLVRLAPHLPGVVVVSNVAGPRRPLRAFGEDVENFVSVGHLKWAAGLNVTVWSYGDKLNFGLYACAAAHPQLDRIADHIAASFEELAQAAAREAPRVEPGAAA
jgi:WS/DGAT/MGAT family acyltransferase